MNRVYMLDTNIVSEFSKDPSDEHVTDLYNIRKNLCAISAITWQELSYGVSRLPKSHRKTYLEQCLVEYTKDLPVIPYDAKAAELCGRLQSQCEKAGKPLSYNDAQIAATAMSRGMVLVTHNTADFAELVENSFLKMEDWFEA